MSTTYRANSGLRRPALDDQLWNVPNDANFDDLDASPMYGGLCVTTAEHPSGSLNVDVAAGRYAQASGAWAAYAGGTAALAASQAAVYVWLTDAGVLTTGAAWPTAAHVPLAVAVTGATTLSALTDMRVPLASGGVAVDLSLAGGTFADAAAVVVVHTGTAHGTQFSGSAAELLGFWGHAPVPQPSGAAQAALGALSVQTVADATGGTASTALAAVAAGAAYTQADMVAVRDALASLASQANRTYADLTNVRALVNALQAALVSSGQIKGSS